jgi:hypothetical protein
MTGLIEGLSQKRYGDVKDPIQIVHGLSRPCRECLPDIGKSSSQEAGKTVTGPQLREIVRFRHPFLPLGPVSFVGTGRFPARRVGAPGRQSGMLTSSHFRYRRRARSMPATGRAA